MIGKMFLGFLYLYIKDKVYRMLKIWPVFIAMWFLPHAFILVMPCSVILLESSMGWGVIFGMIIYKAWTKEKKNGNAD